MKKNLDELFLYLWREKNRIIGFLEIRYTQFPNNYIYCKCSGVNYIIFSENNRYRLYAINGNGIIINTIHISKKGLLRHINDITMSVIDELAQKDIDCQNL